jgi:hypothetical protein
MMHEADRLAFEDRVLAHFDGVLDEAQSERLLAEVAADSEKQQIFAQHQELDKLILTSRIPLETPEETRRSIAAVIPGITTYLPEFITTGTTVSLLATRWRAVLDFLTQTPIRTALTLGGAAAVLTTSVLVTNNLVSNRGNDKPSTRVERMAQPSAPVAPSAVASSTTEYSSAANAAAGGAASNASSASASASSQSHRLNHALATDRDVRESSTRSLSTSNIVSANQKESAVRGGMTPSAEEPSLDAIATVRGTLAAEEIQHPHATKSILTPLNSPMHRYSDPYGITVSVGFGTRVLFKPAIDGQSQPADISTPVTYALRVPLSNAIGLIAEGGNESFVRVRQSGSVIQSFGSLQRFRISTAVIPDNSYWTRVGAEYQFANDAWAITPFVSASAGVAFAQKLAPMVAVGGGMKWYVSDTWKIIATANYDQTWISREQQNFTIPESAVLDINDLHAGTVSNSALNISIGLSTTF